MGLDFGAKMPRPVVFMAGLILACIHSAAASDGPSSTVVRYGPSSAIRTALLSNQRDRFPYVGSASVNAVLAGYDDIVVRLLSNPARRKAEGPDALLAAIQGLDFHLVGLILALGVDPNDVHGGGAGALAYAVTAGENKSLCLLADYGVRMSAGIAPHMPLLAALTSGNLDAAQLLRFLGYEPSEQERNRLHEMGAKRGQQTLWAAVTSLDKNEEKAATLCHRLNAVPTPATRISGDLRSVEGNL